MTVDSGERTAWQQVSRACFLPGAPGDSHGGGTVFFELLPPIPRAAASVEMLALRADDPPPPARGDFSPSPAASLPEEREASGDSGVVSLPPDSLILEAWFSQTRLIL